MRFIIVTQTFPPRTGGMQNVMENLSIKLSNNHKTIVFPDHKLPSEHKLLKSSIQFNFTSAPKLIRKYIKKFKLIKTLLPNDCIVCDSWKSLTAIPENNYKIITLAHGQEFLSKKNHKKISDALTRSSMIICSSSFTKNLILKDWNYKTLNITVIPPTYSLDKERIVSKPKSYDKSINLITLSRLEVRKGHKYVLQSLYYLKNQNLVNNFKWLICGDGPLKKDLENLAKQLGLSKNIRFLGNISNKEKFKLLNQSDLFVMPSIKHTNSVEGFGISYIEAAKYGIPSISGIEGGAVDAVIHNKTGWNVDPLNTNKLNKVMFEALNNHEKRIEFGKNAQKTFLDKFSGERVFKKFLENVKILY